MKVYITYFYNIRFLSPNILPLSTAVWDPKWYHANMGQDYIFEDKRGVYNGFRIERLNPSKLSHCSCGEACKQEPDSCDFIEDYYNYIFSLNFNSVYNEIIELAKGLQVQKNLRNIPDVCLLVHEKPDNPCSERNTIIDWFKQNGVDVEEFSKG